MKPPEFDKFVFRLNVIVTGIVFLLLAPTTHIYSTRVPDKEDSLWLFPLLVVTASSLMWFFMRLTIPILIRLKVLEDRRKLPRGGRVSGFERFFRLGFPVVVFMGHMILLVAVCIALVQFMRSDTIDHFLVNLP